MRTLVSAIRAVKLYPPNNPVYSQSVKKSHQVARPLSDGVSGIRRWRPEDLFHLPADPCRKRRAIEQDHSPGPVREGGTGDRIQRRGDRGGTAGALSRPRPVCGRNGDEKRHRVDPLGKRRVPHQSDRIGARRGHNDQDRGGMGGQDAGRQPFRRPGPDDSQGTAGFSRPHARPGRHHDRSGPVRRQHGRACETDEGGPRKRGRPPLYPVSGGGEQDPE